MREETFCCHMGYSFFISSKGSKHNKPHLMCISDFSTSSTCLSLIYIQPYFFCQRKTYLTLYNILSKRNKGRNLLPCITRQGLRLFGEGLLVAVSAWRAGLTPFRSSYLPLRGERPPRTRCGVGCAVLTVVSHRASVIASERGIVGLIYLWSTKQT